MNVHDGCNAINALTTVFCSQRNLATGEKQQSQISFHFGVFLEIRMTVVLSSNDNFLMQQSCAYNHL